MSQSTLRQARRGSPWFARILMVVWGAVAIGAVASGIDYYVLPFGERAFDPLHELYAPTGKVGHTFGMVGTLMIVVGVATYTLRKRSKALRRVGKMKAWLEFHIFLCTLGPFLIILHSSFKFGGIVSIALWSMMIVVVSGVFGRYVYAWIPKTLQGQFLTADRIAEEVEQTVGRLTELTGLPTDRMADLIPKASTEPSGLASAVIAPVRFRLGLGRRRRALATALSGAHVPDRLVTQALDLALEQQRIQTQMALLRPFQRLFRYWHVVHLPLALLMLVIVTVHVVVVAMFGYGWVL